MRSRTLASAASVCALALSLVCAAETHEALKEQVRTAESAFAKTMADRDHAGFASYLADEAVFFGATGVTRGKEAVAAAWRGYFEGPDAPFSWSPAEVEVLDSGTLALSSGPVFDTTGNRVGTFTSVWRRESDGAWRVVLDKGCPPCTGDRAQSTAPDKR